MHFYSKDGSVSKIYLVAFILIAGIICHLSSAKEVSSKDKRLTAVQALAQSNIDFTNSIYKVLSEKEGNIFFSPISIYVILAMMYMGARGETALQMARGLRLPTDNELITTGFDAVIQLIKSDENLTLEIANKIFTDERISLKEEYQEIARKYFHSEVESVDFGKNTNEARTKINEWVEGKTNSKIKDMIADGFLTADTVMVLVNAIYFKSDWATKFDPGETRTENFYLTPTKTKDVQMMKMWNKRFGYTYNSDLDCQVLQLPYKGGKLTLLIILPNELDGLPNLESKLPSFDFDTLIDRLYKTKVDVSLPKFKLEESTNLVDALNKLGLGDIFEPSANFSGLTDTPVSVSKIVHKAFIEVNEEGTEAAAATGGGVELTSEPPSFVANHPFWFAIFDMRLRTPLLAGRYAGP